MSGQQPKSTLNQPCTKMVQGQERFRAIFVAITGASGAIYGQRFLQRALDEFEEIGLTISFRGAEVIQAELGIEVDFQSLDADALIGRSASQVQFYHPMNLQVPAASGSSSPQAMVVVPCSMGTVGRLAAGISNDLITRAGDVMLKEKRPLILVARETPLNLIHLRNLTTLAEAGATILPAMPGFYQKPKTVDDLVNFVVARILQQLGIP